KAYTINREYMKKIINLEYIDIPIDIIYKHNKLTYLFFPILISQSSLGSDIGTPTFVSNTDFIEYLRNLFFYYYLRYINLTIGMCFGYFIFLQFMILGIFYPSVVISISIAILS